MFSISSADKVIINPYRNSLNKSSKQTHFGTKMQPTFSHLRIQKLDCLPIDILRNVLAPKLDPTSKFTLLFTCRILNRVISSHIAPQGGLCDKTMTFTIHQDAFVYASKKGWLSIIQWLYQINSKSEKYKNHVCKLKLTAQYAAMEGHIHVLDWLRSIEPFWTEWKSKADPRTFSDSSDGCSRQNMSSICNYAAQHGRLEVLKWAEANDCLWTFFACDYALKANHIKIFQWIHSSYLPCEHTMHKFLPREHNFRRRPNPETMVHAFALLHLNRAPLNVIIIDEIDEILSSSTQIDIPNSMPGRRIDEPNSIVDAFLSILNKP